MPSAEIGISGGFGGFHLADDLLAKLDSVAHDFEGEGVVAHSGDDAEIAFRATGDDNMVVVQARQRAIAIVELNFRRGKIYPLHALGPALDTGEHLT